MSHYSDVGFKLSANDAEALDIFYHLNMINLKPGKSEIMIT